MLLFIFFVFLYYYHYLFFFFLSLSVFLYHDDDSIICVSVRFCAIDMYYIYHADDDYFPLFSCTILSSGLDFRVLLFIFV